MEVIRPTSSQIICHETEQLPYSLHVSLLGHSSLNHRRYFATLAQHGRLYSIRDAKESNKQIQAVSKLQDDPGYSVVASQRVVPGPFKLLVGQPRTLPLRRDLVFQPVGRELQQISLLFN